jgi:hypothetical protein
MGHVVKSAAPHFQAISVKEVLEDVFGHFRLRIMHRGLWHEFVDDTHAEVDEFLDEMLFQLLMHLKGLKE